MAGKAVGVVQAEIPGAVPAHGMASEIEAVRIDVIPLRDGIHHFENVNPSNVAIAGLATAVRGGDEAPLPQLVIANQIADGYAETVHSDDQRIGLVRVVGSRHQQVVGLD